MTVPAITDPQAVPTYAPTAFQKWVESMLVDPRDAVFFRLWLKHSLLMVPLITVPWVKGASTPLVGKK